VSYASGHASDATEATPPGGATSSPTHEPGSHDAPVARVHLLGLALAQFQQWLEEHGHERYRAAQVLDWLYAKDAESFAQMTNLSKGMRAWLAERVDIYRSQITRQSVAADGTRKLLLTWPDDCAIEAVWIPAQERNTACVSSQVGCPVGCRFCASGLDGMLRNLTAGEIVEQVLRIRRLIAEQGSLGRERQRQTPRLTNVVFMGVGEPLANYTAVVSAARILNAPWGLGIGARRITISTIGLPKQIRRLAGEELQINLALSLHAPDDDLRRELIPWVEGVKIAGLIDACRYYFEQTGREVTLEYVLLAGVNDRPRHATKLAAVAKRLRANVNLLRYNPVPEVPYERPSAASAHDFQERLRQRGVNAHIRASRGADAGAACGQLRRSSGAEGPTPDRSAI
jgi:23S rRNA (adenine2503-C2)-methyltransferase